MKFTHSLCCYDFPGQVEQDKRIKTGIGRGRMWIRLALNESASSLESYLRMFSEDTIHRPKFYGPNALLNDPEQLSVAMMLLVGLDFLSFNVNFDGSLLDPSSGGTVPSANGAGLAVVQTTSLIGARVTEEARTSKTAQSEFPAAVMPSADNHTFGDVVEVDALTAAPDDDLLHAHIVAKPKKKGKKKRKKKLRDDDGAPTTTAVAPTSDVDTSLSRMLETIVVGLVEDVDGDGNTTGGALAAKAETAEEPLADSRTDGVATSDAHIAASVPENDSAVESVEATQGVDPSEYIAFKRRDENTSQLQGMSLPWGGEVLEPEALHAAVVSGPAAPSRTGSTFIANLDRMVVNRPAPELFAVASAQPVQEGMDSTPLERGDASTATGAADNEPDSVDLDASTISNSVPSPLTTPPPPSPSPLPSSAFAKGSGADVDLVADGNLLLMIKLQVFQRDDEELIKIAQLSMLRGNAELVVHLLVTNVAIYVLIPPTNSVDASYEAYGAFGITDVRDVKSTHDGQGLMLSVRGRRGDLSWQFLTGDSDVTTAFIQAISGALAVGGGVEIVGGAADDTRWHHAVAQMVGSQQDEHTELSCYLSYIEVDPAVYADADVHLGMLELKEPGFLSSTWRPQYFVLQGKVLAHYSEKPAAGQQRGRPKSAWSIEDDDFFCRECDDAEREDCLEIGNASSAITVAGTSHELMMWSAFLGGNEPVVIGTPEVATHSEPGMSWLPAATVLTESHIYICRPDFIKCSLQLLWSEAIETVTALRSTETARTWVAVEFDAEDETTRQWRILMKTRPSLLRFADSLGSSWKELYQVDLDRHLL